METLQEIKSTMGRAINELQEHANAIKDTDYQTALDLQNAIAKLYYAKMTIHFLIKRNDKNND